MADLGADGRALGVDGLGQFGQSGNGLGPHPDLPAVGAAAGAYRAVGDGGHADATGRGQPVIVDQILGDQRVRR